MHTAYISTIPVSMEEKHPQISLEIITKVLIRASEFDL